jgi:glycosyltransferase involved in cell wall biosynthesis
MVLRCLTMMHGGGETRHLAWARELRAAGDEVTLITGRPLMARPKHEVDPSTIVVSSPYTRDLVYRLQGRRGFGRLGSSLLHADEEWFCRAVWRRIAGAARRPDIVHFHALPQAARLRRQDVPTIVNLPGEPHHRYIADLQQADAVVADGWAARHLPALLGRPVAHVPKGVDTEVFAPDGPSKRAELRLEGRRVALVISRLVPIKNVALAIDAVGLIAARHPGLVLVVVGDGPLRADLERRAASANLAGRVLFAGRVPHGEVPAWYRAADLFVLTSVFDNSPNVVLEAMACGLPVVATDVGGVGDYVKHGVNGRLVPLNDAAALAEEIGSLAADVNLSRRIGRDNREDVLARYSWTESARVLRDVYRRVLEQPRQAA